MPSLDYSLLSITPPRRKRKGYFVYALMYT